MADLIPIPNSPAAPPVENSIPHPTGGKKLKILTISDHPLIPSGVGTQTRYVIEGLLRTGKYTVRSWGAAIKHPDYRPQKVFPEVFGSDWIIWPTDGYGDRDRMRSFILNEKPDVLLIVTDPRFYTWLFEMSDEILQNMPIVYWHVWDNDPTPEFNEAYYESISRMVPLSLKTYGLLQDLNKLNLYKGKFDYVPHAVPKDTFHPVPEEVVMNFRQQRLGPHWNKKFIVFWNNRNARRKMSGDVIATFAKFAHEVGKENVALFLQTQVKDPEGQDLLAVANKYKIDTNLIISEARVSPEDLNMFYNAADVTLNIANNEGFGLGTLESMMCGTPIVVHMTGGLQFQIGDWWEGRKDFTDQDDMTEVAKKKWMKKEGKWWGVPVFPASRSCTGSQPIPYIYDDRVAHEDVVKALKKLYDMGRPERKALGLQSREWAIKTFNMEFMLNSFDRIITEAVQEHTVPSTRIVTL
jgi:glycosyltransferase involved in cell wall biosynthesis